MTFEAAPAAFSLARLARACAEESGRYQRGEPATDRYCLELVRRAVCERDGGAWEAVLAQYRGLVAAWVRQHPASAALAEDADYWVTRAFERFWMAVGPDRFGAFGHMASVLRYLKLCVHSVLLDEARSRSASPAERLDTERADLADRGDLEADVVGRVSGRELWAAIERALPDEAERRVVYCSFALDLKPGEIHQRYRTLFSGVADVYRIKRNALDRLRRSEQIVRFLALERQDGPAARLVEEP